MIIIFIQLVLGKPHTSSRIRVYREINREKNINNNAKQRRTNAIANKFNIYGGSRLPENPGELTKNGWDDITHPSKKANHDGSTYLNPKTSQKVEFDKGNPKLTGFRGKDHYHWYNPNSIEKKTDYYLDKYGRPCGKGSFNSHILPKVKKEENNMLKLKMLTRNFHDQLCDKVELKDTELNVFIYAYECGEKYYYNELYENGNKVEESSEELRRLKITFCGVKNINSDFKWDFKEPLNIYELNTTNNKVEFRLYFDDGNENFLSFECIGFDIEYLE